MLILLTTAMICTISCMRNAQKSLGGWGGQGGIICVNYEGIGAQIAKEQQRKQMVLVVMCFVLCLVLLHSCS